MNKHSVMYPDNGTGGGAAAGGGAAGTGGAAAAGSGAAAGAGGAASGGGAAQGPFADVAAARAYLGDYVNDSAFLQSVPDDKIMPWATHHKSRTDEFAKSFPGGWRELLAGEEKDDLKTLERFATPTALWQSTKALRQRMSSGELRAVTPFPEKGTAQEQSAWRSANGVPEKPEGYEFKFGQGVNLSDDDKGILASIQKMAHSRHIPAAQAQAWADWFIGERQARVEKRAELDDAFRTESEDALRAHFGNDFRPNMNRLSSFMDQYPELKELLGKARLGDGSLLGDHPVWVKTFVDLARQLNPAGVLLPGAGADIGKTVSDEIASWEEKMKDKGSDYWKGPNAEKNQARYRALISQRDQIASRKAA